MQILTGNIFMESVLIQWLQVR